jgi:hypothetical protein
MAYGILCRIMNQPIPSGWFIKRRPANSHRPGSQSTLSKFIRRKQGLSPFLLRLIPILHQGFHMVKKTPLP